MNIVVLMFGAFGLIPIGALRILRGAPDPKEEHPDAAPQGAAYIGLAIILVSALAWYYLLFSRLWIFVLPIPYFLGMYSLSCARRFSTAILGFIDYAAPLVTAWFMFSRMK